MKNSSTKTAVLGQRGSFHYLAAKKMLENGFEPVLCSSFHEIITMIKSGKAGQGLIAIENSTAGSILPNYSLIRETGLKIKAEFYDRIELSLLVKKGVSLGEIREIRTHSMAYQQCRDFLTGLGEVSFTEVSDTAAAADYISRSENSAIAAIAHRANATLYNLEVLQDGIETFKRNYTRFFLVSDKPVLKGNENKATVSFSLSHHPGSLAELLTALAENKINLTKIQSFPVPGNPGEYRFYADLEITESCAEKMYAVLLEKTRSLSLLGLYESFPLDFFDIKL